MLQNVAPFLVSLCGDAQLLAHFIDVIARAGNLVCERKNSRSCSSDTRANGCKCLCGVFYR